MKNLSEIQIEISALKSKAVLNSKEKKYLKSLEKTVKDFYTDVENKADDLNKKEEPKENNLLLDALNALQIADKAEKSLSGKKSIFKESYNSKNKRSAIRGKLYGTESGYGLLELYCKFLKENKIEESKKCLDKIKSLCDDAYISESKFENYSAYATDNLGDNKLNILKQFITIYNLANPISIIEE